MRIDSIALFSYQKLVFRFSNFEEREEEGEEREELNSKSNHASWGFLGFCFGASRFFIFYLLELVKIRVARDLILFFKFGHVTRVWNM